MSYFLPKTYVCPKCNGEQQYSPSDSFPAPVLSGKDGINRPICPFCYAKFLEDTFPVMIRKAQEK